MYKDTDFRELKDESHLSMRVFLGPLLTKPTAYVLQSYTQSNPVFVAKNKFTVFNGEDNQKLADLVNAAVWRHRTKKGEKAPTLVKEHPKPITNQFVVTDEFEVMQSKEEALIKDPRKAARMLALANLEKDQQFANAYRKIAAQFRDVGAPFYVKQVRKEEDIRPALEGRGDTKVRRWLITILTD